MRLFPCFVEPFKELQSESCSESEDKHVFAADQEEPDELTSAARTPEPRPASITVIGSDL